MRRLALWSLLVSVVGCGGSGDISGTLPPTQDLPEDPDAHLQGDPDAGEIAITSPEDNLLTASRSVEVEGIVREGEFTEVELAGEMVPVAADGTFSGRVDLQEGVNEIHARAGDADAWVVVRRDSVQPVITINTPTRGAFVNARQTPRIDVTGAIADDHGLTSVTVNGAPAFVDQSGAFRFTDESAAYGVRYYQIEAVDTAGNVGATGLSVLFGEFSPQDQPVENAVVGLVGPSVLDSVAHAAQDALGGLDMQAVALENNPVMDEWWATVDVTYLERGALEIALVPTNAGLEATVTVRDVNLGFHVDLPGPYNPDGTAWASAAVLSGTVDVWATDSGTIDAALIEDFVWLEGFGFDLVPTGVEDIGIVQDNVRAGIEGALRSQVEARVPAEIAAQLQALDLSREIPLTEIGTSLWIDVRPTYVGIDRGGVSLFADGALYGDDAGVTPPSPGTLRTPSDYPSLAGDGVQVAIADDTLNQVLSAAWKAGMLDRDLPLAGPNGPVKVSSLSLLFPALEGAADGNAAVLATLDPLLPPVAALTAEGATLEIGELHMVLTADDADHTPLMTVALHVTANLAAEFGDFGSGASVSLSLLDWEVVADPVVAPDGTPHGEEFHTIVATLVDMFAPEIEGPLTSLPLPSFGGFTFANLDARPTGPAGDYLSLTCDVQY